MSEWVLLGVGLLLTVGTGLFVASEFALVNLDRHEIEQRQARGERGLGTTIGALRRTSTHLSSAQLGITLTTLLTGYTFEPAVSSLLEDPLAGVGLEGGAARAVSAVVGVVLATLLSMILGELVPKNFALAVPRQTARLVVPFQVAFTAVFRPVVALLNGTANRVIRSFGVEPQEELSGARSAEELTFLVRRSAQAGLLEEHDADLLDRTLRFSALDAADVMTPRVRMSSVPSTATAADVVRQSLASGHSRLPVVGDGPDDVLGVVHVKQAWTAAPSAAVTDLMTEPVRTGETAGVDTLLGTLRGSGLQLAVVTDEHGGTAGIVTLEDLVEELVGELEDEFDRTRSDVVRRGRSAVFDASLRPDEVLDRAGVAVPDSEEWETVAGYVLDQLERVPEPGDEVSLPDGGTLRVEHVDGARITRLRHQPAPVAPLTAQEVTPRG
ncbi:HlyC/CorC family transporter [Nocardioides anomalus]|uniref:HlyC/CorC family transporter n=1 Tax=Nocardioides anomalus TaxID=2712223 RepID=A0A6G6WF64_9ACTN|nr:hemolysin family protein [Nocardioides anomalus]QIG43846.1 HlyC/CorC family transporter [Nocardioides anomalus]